MPIQVQQDRLITALEAASILSMSRSGFYAAKNQMGFPEPIRFGTRCVRWRMSDINVWLKNLEV